MKLTVFAYCLCGLFCIGLSPCKAETVVSSMSTYVKKSSPTVNYGSNTTLKLSEDTTNTCKAFIKWDLSAYGADVADHVSNARIRLQRSSGTQVSLRIKQVNSDWIEAGVKWSNMPAGTDVATTYAWDGTYHEISGTNLDTLVKAWIQNPSGNFGVLVEQIGGTTTQEVYSDDFAAQDSRPTLFFDIVGTLPVAAIEYKLDEVGSIVANTGSLVTDANGAMLKSPSPGTMTDMHTAVAGGLSAVSTDFAFDNTSAGAMGTAGNATGGVITVNDNDALDGLQSFTVMMWLKGQDQFINNATLASKSDGANGFVLSVINERLRLTVNGTSVDSAQLLETKDKWCMVAVCYDGTITTNNVRFYVGADYALSTTLLSTASLAGGTTIGNASPLLIGNDSQFGSPYKGVIDNVRVFASSTSSAAILLSDQIEQYRQTDIAGGPGSGTALINVDMGKSQGQVRRRVFGICAMEQQYNTPLINTFAPILENSSLRAWWSDLIPTNLSTLTTDNLIFGINTTERYLVNPYTGVDAANGVTPWQAYYNSKTDNNLGQYWWWQTVDGQADIIDRLNKRWDYPHYGFKYFEIWNEPQVAQNGTWPAVDYARYVIDCSAAAKLKDSTIKVGACLVDTATWNSDMLNYIVAQGKGNSIQFCIDHAYNWQWWQVTGTDNQYYAKVFQTGDQAHRMRGLRKLLDSYGFGWELAVTEWNVHPNFNGSSPVTVARDLGAALFQASTLQKYIEEGVDAATVFQLRSDSNRQFGMVQDSDAVTKRPPFYVFDWYGRYFRGIRCDTAVRSPSVIWSFPGGSAPAIPSTLSPYIEAATAYDSSSGKTCIMIVNKHLTDNMHVVLKISGSGRFMAKADVTTLNASDVWSDVPVVSTSQISGTNNTFMLDVPAHSLTMLQMPTIDLAILVQSWLQTLPCDQYLAGDLNGSVNGICSVDFVDFAIFAQSWLQ